MTMREQVARTICDQLGYPWETLYADKSEWIDDRGARHDINTPYTDDMLDAADAAILAVLTALETGAMDLAHAVSKHAWLEPDEGAAIFVAMIQEAKK